MPTQPVLVYNPDDEPDKHGFNGTEFLLAPNSTTDLSAKVNELRQADPLRWEGLTAEDVAAHLVAELGRFGVMRTRGEVTRGACVDPADEPTVAAAERQYDLATRAWAQEILLARARAVAPYAQAGFQPPDPSPQEAKAQAWLDTHPQKIATPGDPLGR